MTEPLSRIFNKAGISTTIRSRGSLREALVRPKDKLGLPDSTGVVYYLPCSGANGNPCAENGCYVGETERTVASRIKEHFSTAKISGTSTLKSAVMTHARENNHHFRRSDFTVLSSGDQNWHDRGVKEAIYIRALQPTINRDQGRHLLPPNFDSLLQEHVKRPSAPLVHDADVEPILSTAPRRQGRPPRQSQTQSQPQTQSQTQTQSPSQAPPQATSQAHLQAHSLTHSQAHPVISSAHALPPTRTPTPAVTQTSQTAVKAVVPS